MFGGYKMSDFFEFDYRDPENNEKLADQLEKYLDCVNRFIIFPDQDKKAIDKAQETIKKAIKNLRKNRPEKVFDMEKVSNYDMYDENEY